MASKATEARITNAQTILKDLIKVEGDVIVVDPSVEEKLLSPVLTETGVSADAYKTITNYAFEVKSAFAIEAARAAASAFKANKNLTAVKGSFDLGNFEISASVEKEHQFRNPSDKDKMITRNLYTQASANGRGGYGKARITAEIQSIWDASC